MPRESEDVKWVVLTTAPNEWTAHIWQGILNEADITIVIRGGDVNPFLGSSPFPVRLLVREHQKDEALDVLQDQLGPAED